MSKIKALGVPKIKALGLNNMTGEENPPKKSLSIKYISCSIDKKFIHLNFEVYAKGLDDNKAEVYVDELDSFINDTAVPKTEIIISKNDEIGIMLKFDKNKNFTESFFDDGNIFQATITCDGLSAKSEKFKLSFRKDEKKEHGTERQMFLKLQKEYELEANKIEEYRKYIEGLSVADKVKWYNELQKHVKYHSQRDNDNPDADVMCNLTTMAMNMEYLGISCPQKNIQFEDWLESQRVKNKYPKRTDPNSWIKLAKDLGVKGENISIWTNHGQSEEQIKKQITETLKPYLEKGYSISLSTFTIQSGKGHIVKLQSIREDGIIVDDPYGQVNNFKERDGGGSGYKNTKNSKDGSIVMGKDNLWTWADIKIATIKYAVVFLKIN